MKTSTTHLNATMNEQVEQISKIIRRLPTPPDFLKLLKSYGGPGGEAGPEKEAEVKVKK